jgi:sortase A
VSTGIQTRVPTGPGGRRRPGPGQRVVRGIGEALVTVGLILLLFVFYQVYVTDWMSQGRQNAADSEMDARWSNARGELPPIPGKGMARLYIPALGADYRFIVIHGTTDADLAIGPGHYIGTELPGKPGNFAVAGHRVGKGAPFNDIDLVQACDAMVVETNTSWYVYRMLPKADQVANWAQTRSQNPKCAGVSPLGVGPGAAEYRDTAGQEIVDPSENDVIASVPHHLDSKIKPDKRAALITLTTCHPRFSDQQRLIVHGVLVKTWRKDVTQPNNTPPELKETQ